MSRVHIGRTVENIRDGNVLTPIIEVIVNAIHAVESTQRTDGCVRIVIRRQSPVNENEQSLPEVCGFSVIDNGIGFTNENRNSFDDLYSPYKVKQGGKGFGRLICLKYFKDVRVSSVFRDGDRFVNRRFIMGKEWDFIVDEMVASAEATDTETCVELDGFKLGAFPHKTLMTLAHLLTERLLPFIFEGNEAMPDIVVEEDRGRDKVCLGDLVGNRVESYILHVPVNNDRMMIGDRMFSARVYKCYASQKKTSRVILVGHRREVTEKALYHYVPEFKDEYCETVNGEPRYFVVTVYVQGEYLDEHVCPERGAFDFPKDRDLFCPVCPEDIEREAANLAVLALDGEVESRFEKKKRQVEAFVREKNPWLAGALSRADLSDLNYGASELEIMNYLCNYRNADEIDIRQRVEDLIRKGASEDLVRQSDEIFSRISQSGRDELAHYVALRRLILGLMEKSLERGSDGKYPLESVLHNLIFPMQSDSVKSRYFENNLWLLDERLNFTEYLCSDEDLTGSDIRPDLFAYERKVAFRNDNEASNPITVFEFKRPGRDDFADRESREDPVQKMVDFVRDIRSNKVKTATGREVEVTDNTPVYAYLVCTTNRKVRDWLIESKNFKILPDGKGFFQLYNQPLYFQVFSWEKVLKDATMRNRIFFHKLGIDM